MKTHRLSNGSWAAGLGEGWRAYSSGSAVYSDVDAGRKSLIRWARMHVACSEILSPSRCIVLSATGEGSWRLWQIVRAERSLLDELHDLEHVSPEHAAARLLDTATLLCDLSARLEGLRCQLPCSLNTVASGARGPAYIGLMPEQRVHDSIADIEPFGTELASLLHGTSYDRRGRVLDAIVNTARSSTPRGTALLDPLIGRMIEC